MKRDRRGMSNSAAMMAILGLTAVVTIGWGARVTELSFSDPSRCRAAARWAAESAVAVGRSQLARTGRATSKRGALPDGVGYALEVEVVDGESILNGTGECTSQGRTTTQRVQVRLAREGRSFVVKSYRDLAAQ